MVAHEVAIIPVADVDHTLAHVGQEPTAAELVEAFIDKKPTTRGVLDGPLANAEDGVYLSPALLPHTEALPQLVDLQLLPGAELGAADSHHGVVFGRVALRIEDLSSVIGAAFKEFTTESEQALREHAGLLAARERGFETFTPLAVARDGDRAYLITFRREEVHSLDNEDWSIKPDDPRYETDVIPNLHFMADSFARLHAKGIFHGDGQPKNVAKTDTGEYVAMDLEDCAIAYTEDELVQMVSGGWEPRDSLALTDIWHCWYAMTHPINGEEPDDRVNSAVFLESDSYETCMEQFEVNFLNPYITALRRHSSPELFARFNADEVREALYKRVAMTT